MSAHANEFHITMARPYHPETQMHLLHDATSIHEALAAQDIHIENIHLTIGIGDANYMDFDVHRAPDINMENLEPLVAAKSIGDMRSILHNLGMKSLHDDHSEYRLDVVDLTYDEYADRFRLTFIA